MKDQINIQKMKPDMVLYLVNSTPLGVVLSAKNLYLLRRMIPGEDRENQTVNILKLASFVRRRLEMWKKDEKECNSAKLEEKE